MKLQVSQQFAHGSECGLAEVSHDRLFHWGGADTFAGDKRPYRTGRASGQEFFTRWE